MRTALLLLFITACALGNGAFAAQAGKPAEQPVRIETEEFADLGRVELFQAGDPTEDLLLLLDDASGQARGLALDLARRGHRVAYLPLAHLLDNAGKHHDACIDATTLLDVFSQHIQEKYRFPHYRKPVVIGRGEAAAMAYTIVAQAPQRLFARGIGIDFCPLMKLPAPPCRGTGALGFSEPAPGSYRLQPTTTSTTSWTTLATGPTCADAGTFGHSETVAMADLPARVDALIAPSVAPSIASPALAPARTVAVDDLGLVELPAAAVAQSDDPLVVLLSGDGGWADIDKQIGEQLNRAGLAVVGWNTLQYFWSRKTPEIASADLQRVLAHYRQAWKRERVVLIGFSLGADVLPFMVSRLPGPERARIADIVLLSPGHGVDFEFHVSAWLGDSRGDTHRVAPEIRKLVEPVLCVYGTRDDDASCSELRAANIANVAVPGDHHFEGDFQAVSRLILRRLGHGGAGHLPRAAASE